MKRVNFGSLVLGLAAFSTCLATFSRAAESLPDRTNMVDLRPKLEQWGLRPRQQGARGTCSAFTVAGALEFAVATRQGHSPRLSVEFLNWAANKVGHDTTDGGFFSDLWKGFAAYGICVEEDMPYQAKFDPAQQPGAAAMADAKTRLGLGLRLNWIKEWNVHTGLTGGQFAAIKDTLDKNWPVCGGFRWPKQEQWVADVLQMCPSNNVRDGHSVLLVGYTTRSKACPGSVPAKQHRRPFWRLSGAIRSPQPCGERKATRSTPPAVSCD